MRGQSVTGLLCTVLLFMCAEAMVFSQEGSPRRDLEPEWSAAAIVIETDLYILELDVGVAVGALCYSDFADQPLDPCNDIERLLDEHGVKSDVVARVKVLLEKELDRRIKTNMEREYINTIRQELDRYQR